MGPPDSFRHRIEPCHACVLTLHEAATRYSHLYCARCFQRVDSLNKRFGRLVIPISSHSLVNRSAGARAQDGSASPTPIDEFVEIAIAPGMVFDFTQTVIQHLLSLAGADGEDIAWRTVVDAARSAGLDEDRLFREFLVTMAVPGAAPFSGQSLPAGLWDPAWDADS